MSDPHKGTFLTRLESDFEEWRSIQVGDRVKLAGDDRDWYVSSHSKTNPFNGIEFKLSKERYGPWELMVNQSRVIGFTRD